MFNWDQYVSKDYDGYFLTPVGDTYRTIELHPDDTHSSYSTRIQKGNRKDLIRLGEIALRVKKDESEIQIYSNNETLENDWRKVLRYINKNITNFNYVFWYTDKRLVKMKNLNGKFIKESTDKKITINDITLKMVRNKERDEWVIQWIEGDKIDEEKSYYTDDYEDAFETMQQMAKNIKKNDNGDLILGGEEGMSEKIKKILKRRGIIEKDVKQDTPKDYEEPSQDARGPQENPKVTPAPYTSFTTKVNDKDVIIKVKGEPQNVDYGKSYMQLEIPSELEQSLDKVDPTKLIIVDIDNKWNLVNHKTGKIYNYELTPNAEVHTLVADEPLKKEGKYSYSKYSRRKLIDLLIDKADNIIENYSALEPQVDEVMNSTANIQDIRHTSTDDIISAIQRLDQLMRDHNIKETVRAAAEKKLFNEQLVTEVEKTYEEEKEMTTEEKLRKNRKLFFVDGVYSDSVNRLMQDILLLEAENPKKPIELYINSPGGAVVSGLALIDVMRRCKCEIKTICIGQAASMGAILLACGTKGKRYITEHSRILIHDIATFKFFSMESATDQEIELKETKRLKKQIVNILAEACGHTTEKIEKDIERDYWMSADDSVEYGIVDKII